MTTNEEQTYLADLEQQLTDIEEARAAQRRAEDDAAGLRADLARLREETQRAIAAITEAAKVQVADAVRQTEERLRTRQPKKPKATGAKKPTKTYNGTFAKEAAELASAEPNGQSDYAKTLLQLANYTWHSAEREARARKLFAGALAAARMDPSGDVAESATDAIFDLYDHDRAVYAASLADGRVKPIRIDDIPGNGIYRGSRGPQLQTFTEWARVPEGVPDGMARILEEVTPDEMILVTYPAPDPIVYARYGSWYVKIIEWV